MEKQPCVYLLASRRNGTLYCGVTSDLILRIWQHRKHVAEGSTRRYGITRLVWYEIHPTMDSAIQREKRIKQWNRAWKVRLIDAFNPSWRDLWPDITGQTPRADVHGSPLSRGMTIWLCPRVRRCVDDGCAASWNDQRFALLNPLSAVARMAI